MHKHCLCASDLILYVSQHKASTKFHTNFSCWSSHCISLSGNALVQLCVCILVIFNTRPKGYSMGIVKTPCKETDYSYRQSTTSNMELCVGFICTLVSHRRLPPLKTEPFCGMIHLTYFSIFIPWDQINHILFLSTKHKGNADD